GADPNERSPRDETPLMFASRNGNLDAMKVLLNHQAGVNAIENLRGTTALMWAVEQRHVEAVRLLVERGAKTTAITDPDNKGGTAYLAPSVQQRASQDRFFGVRPAGASERGGSAAVSPGDLAAVDRAAAASAVSP